MKEKLERNGESLAISGDCKKCSSFTNLDLSDQIRKSDWISEESYDSWDKNFNLVIVNKYQMKQIIVKTVTILTLICFSKARLAFFDGSRGKQIVL